MAGDGGRGDGRRRSSATTRAAALLLATAWSGYLVYVALLPQLQEDKGIATSNLGWLGTAGFLATFVGQAFVAPHADRLPQRTIAAVAAIVLAAGLLLFAAADHLALLIVARALAGIGLGVFSPVLTAAAMRRARGPDGEGAAVAAGVLQAAASAGIAIGPFLGALVVDRVSASTILVVGALVIVAMQGVLRFVPHRGGSGVEATFDGAAALVRTRAFWGAALIGSAFMAAVGAYDTLWSRFMDDLGASSRMIGLSFVLFAVPYALMAGPASRYVDRTSAVRAAALGGVAMVLSIVAYATLTSPTAIVLVALLESSGQAFVSVASTVAIARAAPVERQASAHGLSSAVTTLVAAATSSVAAPVYAAGGAGLLFGLTAGVYAAIMVVALVLTHGAMRRLDRPGGAVAP